MKELFHASINIIIAFLLILSPIFAHELVEHHNEQNVSAVVDTVNGGYVTLVDTDGEAWVWECEGGERAYHEGEEVTITFDTFGTEDIYDDEIVKIRRG